jgi:hypothetical protein
MSHVIVEFVEVVLVRVYCGWTCVFLRFEVLQKSPDNLSHKNSPLGLVLKRRIGQGRIGTIVIGTTLL